MGLIVKNIVRKRYGRRLLDSVSVRLKSGTVTLLSGFVHSGRTTLLRVIAQVLLPHSGAMKYPPGAVAFAPEHPLWPMRFDTVLDILRHYALLYPRMQSELIADYIPTIIKENKEYRYLSKKERRLLSNALTMFSGASVLLFDEPLQALSLDEKRHFLILLNHIARESDAVTVVSLFGKNDIVDFIDDIVVMRNGGVTYAGSVREALVKHRIVRSMDGVHGDLISPLIDSFLVKTGEAVGWEPTLEEVLHAYTHYEKPTN